MRWLFDRVSVRGAILTAAVWLVVAVVFVSMRPDPSWPWFTALYVALALLAGAVAILKRRA